MIHDQATPERNYEQFIEEARASQRVWGLQSEDGWAYCESAEYEETDVVVFWSDRADALKHVKEDWSEHVPTEIPLDEFCEEWLQGMDADGAMVGVNWTADLVGLEVEPVELAERLIDEEADERKEK